MLRAPASRVPRDGTDRSCTTRTAAMERKPWHPPVEPFRLKSKGVADRPFGKSKGDLMALVRFVILAICAASVTACSYSPKPGVSNLGKAEAVAITVPQ